MVFLLSVSLRALMEADPIPGDPQACLDGSWEAARPSHAFPSHCGRSHITTKDLSAGCLI